MQLFVNDLTVMDFSYLCPQRGMVGESWIVDVALNGELNEESMILDFGKVKKQLKTLIDEYVDHKLLVPAEHAFTRIEHNTETDVVKVSFARPAHQSIHLLCPAEAYAFIYASQIDMASVGQYLQDVIAIHLPDNVANIELYLRHEVISTPYYHYTHGLKKHDGNCQRIAHGHRSKILIEREGKLDERAMSYWATRWADIYVATHEDQIALTALQGDYTEISESSHYAFAYESSQGYFELVIPVSSTEIIDTDTTVECLAQYLLQEETKRLPATSLQVHAYEGVGKGARVKG
ncbi:MAG: 6-carboxytetrahydropterin synthase [Glaciecola sp.]|jgi:6-pyruvoyl-tetrahydropterin synthase